LNRYTTLVAVSVAVPAACVAFTIVVTPLASVLVVVTDVCVPEPARVVPDGRFEQVAEDSVKLTWDVATVAPPLAASAIVLVAVSATATIRNTVVASRFI
jgi:uncharacterized membrane protein